MGFGHYILHSDTSQENLVNARSISAIVGQYASDLRSLDNSDFFDIRVIGVSGHANIAINTCEVSTNYGISSEADLNTEIESNVDNPSLVLYHNDIDCSDSEALDELEPDMPIFNVEAEIILASLSKSKSCLPERPAAIKRKKTKEVCCYWWDESEGETKATIFTCCVAHFLEVEIAAWTQEKPKHIILWSDGCVYQNKNKTIANALLQLATKTNFLIEHKCLEKGHTHMEADSVHASIERRLRNREINHPHDYLPVTREARIKPFPYTEKCITHSFFRNFDFPEGEACSSIRPGNIKNGPTVNDVVNFAYISDGIS
ncbi:hypothetical protein PR048_016510 [Dryococelus australis]|uniref:DUF7869 domain-containing protein n=1 Tax=Dryococelus australis TaxID=614101 RepID=A0ABQ9HJX5_9NEOP|nr:hypothetical protein PR048_016510 [Dryococelus australis]